MSQEDAGELPGAREQSHASPSPTQDEVTDDGYPPAAHVLRDLRVEWEHRIDGASTAWLPVTPWVRAPSGAALAGVLATLVDLVGGGLAAITAGPDWIATADLTLHVLPRPARERVEAHGRVLHRGRTTVVVEVALADADAELGVATMSFARLARRSENPVVAAPVTEPGRSRLALESSGLEMPLTDRAGLSVLVPASGTVEVPLTDYVRNPLGAVQGGIIATAVDAAAVAAVGARCGDAVETVDLQITYVALVKEGPLRTRARVLTSEPHWGTTRVEVLDAADQLTTLATAVAARPA